MSTNERDTHFANAARLLVEKTMATNAMDTLDATRFLRDDDLAELQTLFAQFAYDLARHIVRSTMGGTTNAITTIVAEYVPDLDAWPESH